MLGLIAKVTGTSKNEIRGYRVDAKNKPDIQSMAVYRTVHNKLLDSGIDINEWPHELLDKIAFIMTLNTEPGEIRKQLMARVADYAEITPTVIDTLVTNHTAFDVKTNNQWHRFSLKLMNELIPEMLNTSKEQSTILNERGLIKKEKGLVTAADKIDINKITDDIYNPVVTKSIREALKIFNVLVQKYPNIIYTVVEMPRESNEDEQKKKIANFQKNNAKTKDAALNEFMAMANLNHAQLDAKLRQFKHLYTKIRLWYEQEDRDPYLGTPIDAVELATNPFAYEIDHIIPRTVSFDSRLSNEVVCASDANRVKGKRTPYEFMRDTASKHQSFEAMCAWIRSNKRLSYAKKKNLEFMDDLNSIEVRKRFISRNLVDTRYASRVILNGLQSYANESKHHNKMKVTVIRGQFTSWLRKKWNIPKSRETHHHHAVDATLIASTPLLSLWRKEQVNVLIPQKVNSELVDVATGEILEDDEYKQLTTLPFQDNFANTVRHLENSGRIKFHHQVDKKMNRQISDATIYSTRYAQLVKDKQATEYVVAKIKDIYTLDGWKNFKKIYDKDKSKFIMAQKDPQTFAKLEAVIKEYPTKEEIVLTNNKVKEVDVSPFELYRRDNGYITKYAKKNNGPKVVQVKYYDKKLGNHVDVTPKQAKNKHVVLQSLKPWRTDVYYNSENDKYEIMGIKYSDLQFIKGAYGISQKHYNELKTKEQIASNSEFVFSLYRNDRIKVMNDQNESVELLFGSRTKANKGYVELKPITQFGFIDTQSIPLYGKASNGRAIKPLAKTGWKIWKVNTDELGNPFYIAKESDKPQNIIVEN